jgi:hypothetical protein
MFGPDDNWVHYSGGSNGKLNISSDDELTIRGTNITSTPLSSGNSFNAGSITFDGNLVNSNTVYTNAGLVSRFSANDIYIPPLEEPDIHDIEKLCNDDDPVDLHTYWICAKEINGDSISAEDSINSTHNYFILDPNDDSQIHANSSSIIGVKTGIFNPAAADIGFNKVVFVYCQVNDTIEVEVEKMFKVHSDIRRSSISRIMYWK